MGKPKSESRIALRRFGSLVRDLRRERGWSQERLASEANLDRTYIGGVERGERNISFINISLLAKALEVSVKDFFSD